jgi:hypothetical protein
MISCFAGSCRCPADHPQDGRQRYTLADSDEISRSVLVVPLTDGSKISRRLILQRYIS